MVNREQKVMKLIDKAISERETNEINYDYWESLLFKMTDDRQMTMAEAYAIDKIIGLNLY